MKTLIKYLETQTDNTLPPYEQSQGIYFQWKNLKKLNNVRVGMTEIQNKKQKKRKNYIKKHIITHQLGGCMKDKNLPTFNTRCCCCCCCLILKKFKLFWWHNKHDNKIYTTNKVVKTLSDGCNGNSGYIEYPL